LGLRSALELAQIARQVYLIVPSLSVLDNAMGRKLKASKNVTVLDGYKVKEIKGEETYARSIVVTKGAEEKELAVDVIRRLDLPNQISRAWSLNESATCGCATHQPRGHFCGGRCDGHLRGAGAHLHR
jgi:hypothetical protein